MPLENIRLADSASGAAAQILAGFGFNCYQFRVLQNERPLDVIWATRNFTSGKESASGSGVPILFPFPGRLRGVQLAWGGQHYELQAGDGRGNAIHGFVHNRPWRVIEQSETRAVGQFQASQDDPRLLDLWPADFRITAAYQLHGAALHCTILVENPDDKPLPCGLGVHPYFCAPLGGKSAENCVVSIPVTQQWELADMLATGKRLPLEDAQSFRSGLKFAEMSFDNVFTGLVFEGDRCVASIHDPDSGRTAWLSVDRAFREFVVYNPPHRQAVCIEPYTCAPDPFRLSELDVDAGLRVLAPGEKLEANFEIRVS